MMDKRKMGTLLGAAVLTVGVFLLAATSAKATSGGCFIPTVAVDVCWSAAVDIGEFSDDEKTCKKQCSAWKATCTKVCRHSKHCIDNFTKGLADALKIACSDIEDKAERKACTKEVSAERTEILKFLSEDKKDARADNKDFFDDCLLSCED